MERGCRESCAQDEPKRDKCAVPVHRWTGGFQIVMLPDSPDSPDVPDVPEIPGFPDAPEADRLLSAEGRWVMLSLGAHVEC